MARSIEKTAEVSEYQPMRNTIAFVIGLVIPVAGALAACGGPNLTTPDASAASTADAADEPLPIIVVAPIHCCAVPPADAAASSDVATDAMNDAESGGDPMPDATIVTTDASVASQVDAGDAGASDASAIPSSAAMSGTVCCVGSACTAAPMWYLDQDQDGFGDPARSVAACSQPSGYVANNMDCCDSDPVANPNFLAAHASNPWQIVPDACGNFLWNCETTGVPVKQYGNLTLCNANFCIGECPQECTGFTVSDPSCGETSSESMVTCAAPNGTCAVNSFDLTDALQQGCY